MNIFNPPQTERTLKFFEELTSAWDQYIRRTSPAGPLLNKGPYGYLEGNYPVIVHITSSLEEIKKSGLLFSSGGGLGSAIYGSPLNKDRVPHNIYHLYKNFQLPKKLCKDKLKSLAIKIFYKPNKDDLSSWNVDYTLFGKIHCAVWGDLKKYETLDKDYIEEVENEIASSISKNKLLLNTLISYDLHNFSEQNFEVIYNTIFNEFPELRFILYEVLAEYILFYQNNADALSYTEKEEIYNLNHKTLISDLCPTMLVKFTMKNFFINLQDLLNYLDNKTIVVDFNKNHFLNWFKWRISYYFFKIGLSSFEDNSFESYIQSHPLFIGQILYRKFNNKPLFESYRANHIHALWKEKNLILPIYSIVPKGEMGVNPCLDSLGIKYKIYELTDSFDLGQELNISLSPKSIPDNLRAVR